MSLIRQVWLLVVGAVLLSLAGSVVVSTGSVRQLLQTQLQIKNSDNAASLALALSQQQGDAELMQLVISAQFDTGYYQRVRWQKADGSVAFEREAKEQASQAPAWFQSLLQIEAQPGMAKISNGWNAVGSIEVLSHSAYAYDELWRISVRITSLLLALAVLAAGLAWLVLNRIRTPLAAVVEQASAVVQGRFQTVPESSVPELRRLTQAMNTMVGRLRQMFEAQAEQLQMLGRQAHCDDLTGLTHRRQFLAELESALQRDEGPVQAGLVLLRLRDLASLNQTLGHAPVDQILLTMAQALKVYPERVNGCLAGRLNGSDFALWLPAPQVATDTAQALAEALRASLSAHAQGLQVAIGAVNLPRDTPLSRWFAAADMALARAEARSGVVVETADAEQQTEQMLQGERGWRQRLGEALEAGRLQLQTFPVLDASNMLLHLECPLRIQLDPEGDYLTAMRWLPMALRNRMSGDIDVRAVELALKDIAQDGVSRCVNLAPASLLHGGFAAQLRDLVFRYPQEARKLGLELDESAAIHHFDLLLELGRQLRPLGVKLGLEHVGAGLGKVEGLFHAGLDYVKLDAAVISGVSADASSAAFVRGMVIMFRSLALKVYAEGVRDALDVQALWDCGVDGVTGPWATGQRAGR